jgi:hypothetical protein
VSSAEVDVKLGGHDPSNFTTWNFSFTINKSLDIRRAAPPPPGRDDGQSLHRVAGRETRDRRERRERKGKEGRKGGAGREGGWRGWEAGRGGNAREEGRKEGRKDKRWGQPVPPV